MVHISDQTISRYLHREHFVYTDHPADSNHFVSLFYGKDASLEKSRFYRHSKPRDDAWRKTSRSNRVVCSQ
jgi:hypothetical protein